MSTSPTLLSLQSRDWGAQGRPGPSGNVQPRNSPSTAISAVLERQTAPAPKIVSHFFKKCVWMETEQADAQEETRKGGQRGRVTR